MAIQGGTLEDLVRQAAYARGADPFLIEVPQDAKREKFDLPYVLRQDMPYADILARLLRKMGWEVVEQPTGRAVWVACYDGRKLPYPATVRPMRQPGRAPSTWRAGGVVATAQSLFRALSHALNYLPGGETRRPPVVIIDETSLPGEPAPGQSGEAAILTRHYAFCGGDEAIEPTKRWFEENFGITFHKEERDVKVLILRPAVP